MSTRRRVTWHRVRSAASIRVRRTLAFVATAALLACAAIPNPNQTTGWRDPDFRGPAFHKVFVVGLSAQSLIDQRGFEDLMVSTLKSAGIAAVPGWQFVPADRTPDQAIMRLAVERSGADAVLLVRLSGFTTETSVGYGVVGENVATGPDMYAGWYARGVVTDSYQAATIYTTLFNVGTGRPVWTFNPPTYSPATLKQDAPRYANEVVDRLVSSGLIAAF